MGDLKRHLERHKAAYALISIFAGALGIGWFGRGYMDAAQLADHDQLVAERNAAKADLEKIEDRLSTTQAVLEQIRNDMRARVDRREFEATQQAALEWRQRAEDLGADLKAVTALPAQLAPVSESFSDSMGDWCPWQRFRGPCFDLTLSEAYSGHTVDVSSSVLNKRLGTRGDEGTWTVFQYDQQFYEFHVKSSRSQYPVRVDIFPKIERFGAH